MGHKVFRKKVSKKKKEWWDNITPEKREEFKDRARENTLKQMKELEYINPSQLPGVKFKQRYMAYKRYGNEDGMESVRIEAERNGFSLNHKVVSIKAVGNEDAFDIEVKDTHNFAANGIFIHNSGYPDCRDTSIKAVQAALNLCLDYDIIIHTPLMWMTKAGTVLKMDSLGKLDWYKNTVTCYEGKRPPCGKCPSCLLRAKGFEEAGFKDPAVEAFNG
jgi:ssDNA-binding Zn-finger/Zn-ribbon topoisomerase 1